MDKMKSNKDYLREEKFNKIQSLIEDCELEEILEKDEKGKADIIEGDDIPNVLDNSFPGLLKFRMDPMKMTLFMELIAPVNSDNEITIMDIKARTEQYGSSCESAIDWEYIRDTYTRIFFDGEILSEVIIAQGKPVKMHVPCHLLLKEGLITDFKPQIIDGNKVDFHHIHSFIIVQKGECIGDEIPELPGINGLNLLGKEIPYPNTIINNLKLGNNVVVKSGRIYSEIEGSLKIVDDIIQVEPVLDISNDVDYKTGDIDFHGDILVKNSIRENFVVNSGRDILVGDSIEPTNINCGNNINVQHGIFGDNKHTIECKGSVTALHIENSQINACKLITVENGIVNSKVNTLDKMIIGEKSSIVGGLYRIQNGIITGNVGNESGIETKLFLGIDYVIEDKLNKVQIASIQLVCEMTDLQEMLSECETREDKDKLKFLFLKVKSRLNSLNNFSRALLSKLDKNDKSSLTVLGTIYPGTYIEICHISYIIKQELSHVIFTLDKSNGNIKFDYL